MRHLPDPSPELLEAAFRLRRRKGWPDTMLQAMDVPLYAALLRMQALRLRDQQARAAARPPAPAPVALPLPGPTDTPRPAPVMQPRPARPLPAPPVFDRKRLASGDRDD